MWGVASGRRAVSAARPRLDAVFSAFSAGRGARHRAAGDGDQVSYPAPCRRLSAPPPGQGIGQKIIAANFIAPFGPGISARDFLRPVVFDGKSKIFQKKLATAN